MSLEYWNNPIPWRDVRHIQISVATDTSSSGWGATIVSPNRRELFDYWTQEEFTWDIAPKEPMAIDKFCYRGRMKFVTRVSMYRLITRELFTRGTTKVEGVLSLIML